MQNKDIFAKNLKYYRGTKNKTRREICADLGFSYYTYSDWENAKKYPRMDKVEILANYFGILKSDLIEEKVTEEKEKDNELLADIIVRMRTDEDFFSVVESLYRLDPTRFNGVKEMLDAFAQ